MNNEEATFYDPDRKSSNDIDSLRAELAAEKQRVLEIKKVVEAGREKLRLEQERFDRECKSSSPSETGSDRVREKLDREWDQIGAEEKRLENERRKLDILFEEITSRKYALERETSALEKDRTTVGKKEADLKDREQKLASEKEAFEKQRADWEGTRAQQLDELRSLPDRKAELELERANIKLEKMRFEEERKPFEDERRHLEAKRQMMAQEQEILDQQRKIIEEQKKRLLETGTVSIEAKYALEQPIPEKRDPLIAGSRTDTSGSSMYDVGQGNLRQTRYSEKAAQLERVREERLKNIGSNEPLRKAIRPDQPLKRAIRPDQPLKKAIRPDQPLKKAIRPDQPLKKAIRPEAAPEPEPGLLSPPTGFDLDTPTTATSVMPQGSAREEAKIYEKGGMHYIHCLNPNCRSEIELTNASKKRVHCPECGRRNKISQSE